MPNPSMSLRMFPRGFLGGDLQAQTERTPVPFAETVQQHQYRVEGGKTAGSSHAANPFVEALYADLIKQTVSTGSFEFRKKILKAALSAFGTKNFEAWFLAQHQSSACGDLHRRFLDDTLKYIQEGRRDMSLETWGALIKMTDEGNNIGALSEQAKKFFGMQQSGNHSKQNFLLLDVVQQWCTHPNGLEDLLGTLHILFGSE